MNYMNYLKGAAKAAFVAGGTLVGATAGFVAGAAKGAVTGAYEGAKIGYEIWTAKKPEAKESDAADYAVRALPAVIAPIAGGVFGLVKEGLVGAYNGAKKGFTFAKDYIYAEAEQADEEVNIEELAANLQGIGLEEIDNPPAPKFSDKEMELFPLLAQKIAQEEKDPFGLGKQELEESVDADLSKSLRNSIAR